MSAYSLVVRPVYLLLALLLPGVALAGPSPRAVFIAASLDGAAATDGVVQARLGQRVTLYAVIVHGRGRGELYHTAAPALTLGGRPVPRRQLRPLGELGGASFRWSLVEPHPHHLERDPPNPGNPAYANAVLFGARHGQWLGYDVIEYHETPLVRETGPQLEVRRATPTHPRVNVNGGLGTMRYTVTARLPGQDLASPGVEARGRAGISPWVTRVSFRAADDFVGQLTSYFNVPNVFGSGGGNTPTHQTELYQAADCADVIIGGARRAGARIPYTSVLGLQQLARPVTERLLLDESGVFLLRGAARGERQHLRFGHDVRRGDLMLIDYVGFKDSPRTWDHVAVVSRDRGVPGVLDPRDLVLHMGYLYGLTEAEAHTEGPAVVQFLRFRPGVLPARPRPAGGEARPASGKAKVTSITARGSRGGVAPGAGVR